MEYNGFTALTSYSEADKVYHRKIDGIDDLVIFCSDSKEGIEDSFHDAVDGYLDLKRKSGS